MANSLSDQLLKAGLVTQDQIDKSEQDKQQRKNKARANAARARQGAKNGKNTGNHSMQAARKQQKQQSAKATDKKPAKKGGSDLARFYQQRNQLEREEREAEEKQKREAAAKRKQVRKQLRKLITTHSKNVEEADIRFNFVVGETVKYLFVTEEQQQAIADGKLSITFMDGKRCLIPPEIGQQVLALDNSKIVINFKDNDTQEPATDPVSTTEQKAKAVDSAATDPIQLDPLPAE
ncbi:MAG: hypothetical protein CSA79_05325 [Thiothrix nivea]|nr:MAG: hypothetical protein CSA79_05325 [Thiothrix nivea]